MTGEHRELIGRIYAAWNRGDVGGVVDCCKADAEVRIRDVTLVGQYALQIAFESGHATGIYTFSLLRHLV